MSSAVRVLRLPTNELPSPKQGRQNDENDERRQSSISPQARIDAAIRSYERAEAEVDRLCDIIERAAEALKHAREEKRMAQIELDVASKALSNGGGVTAHKTRALAEEDELRNTPSSDDVTSRMDNVGRDIIPNDSTVKSRKHNDYDEEHDEEEEYDEVYSDEESDEKSDYESGRSSPSDRGTDDHGEDDNGDDDLGDDNGEDDYEEGHNGEDDAISNREQSNPNDFDVGNEALDQIRYRLQIAKVDPISAEGTKLLDDLLIRFQRTDEPINVNLVNRFIDELLDVKTGNDPPNMTEEGDEDAEGSRYVSFPKLKDGEPPLSPSQYPRIRISRGGKVLGWYQGQLDDRGYAREGIGSMYYDAGHECHGTWKNDEMIGRGIYKWSDGHVYDGEWSNGKRHGLGRFIRPDGVILYGRYEKGHHCGEGVRWSADRKEAQLMVDGVPKKSVSLAIAEFLALKLGFEDVPPPPIL